MGRDVAIDASDLPAYANGQRFVSKGGRERERFSDPDASWGHHSAVSTRKGGGYYGYKVDAAVCTRTGLPVAWNVRSARANESRFAAPLMDAARARGFAVETCAMDKGYDLNAIHDACEDRDCRPIMPLRETPAVKRGDHQPPTCEHGEWRFAGSDFNRKVSKWRCPAGECKPASRWVKADRLHPLIPRESPRFWKLYKGALPSNASSDASRTSGRYCHSAYVAWIGSSFMLTRRSSPSSPALSPEHEPHRWPRSGLFSGCAVRPDRRLSLANRHRRLPGGDRHPLRVFRVRGRVPRCPRLGNHWGRCRTAVALKLGNVAHFETTSALSLAERKASSWLP